MGENKSKVTEFHLRNLVGFWFLGLCNNFSYVIMLSAAHDILYKNSTSTDNSTHAGNATYLQCNQISTAAILLADIIPCLIIKLTIPLYVNLIGYRVKVILVLVFAAASFLIVGLLESVEYSLIGVACASISSGLGEPVFLGLTAHFHRNVISAWSSGTGGAGLFGALAYAGLTQLGVTPRTAVLIMLATTVWMAVSYFIILKLPIKCDETDIVPAERLFLKPDKHQKYKFSCRQKLSIIRSMFKYMAPLAAVYFAEYFINQGLTELLYFNNFWLSPHDQYRWYQVDYQLGVFISRSSVNLFHIKQLWLLAVLQIVNAALLLTQVFLRFIPSFWIIAVIVLYEGFLGGAAYVNTFYKLYKDVNENEREFSLTVVSVSDTLGICLSGAVSIPSHRAICQRKIKM